MVYIVDEQQKEALNKGLEALLEYAFQDPGQYRYAEYPFSWALAAILEQPGLEAARAAMRLLREGVKRPEIWAAMKERSAFSVGTGFAYTRDTSTLFQLAEEFPDPELTHIFQNWLQTLVFLDHHLRDDSEITLWELCCTSNPELAVLPTRCFDSEWRMALYTPDPYSPAIHNEPGGPALLYRVRGDDGIRVAVASAPDAYRLANRDDIVWYRKKHRFNNSYVNLSRLIKWYPLSTKNDFHLPGSFSNPINIDVDKISCLASWERKFDWPWETPPDGCHLHATQMDWVPCGSTTVKDALLAMEKPVFTGIENPRKILVREWSLPRVLQLLFFASTSAGHHFFCYPVGKGRLQAWQSAATLLGIDFKNIQQIESIARDARWFAFGADSRFFIECPYFDADPELFGTVWSCGVSCWSPMTNKFTAVAMASSDG